MSAQLRPFAEWHEDMGDVLWWRFPITEAPHVGSPVCLGFQVAARLYGPLGEEVGCMQANVGGWPFEEYQEPFLYWQKIEVPEKPASLMAAGHEQDNPYCVCDDCIPF